MKKLIVLLVMVGVGSVVMGAGPPVEWEKTFGGSERDEGRSVQQTTDGGYIALGYTYSFGLNTPNIWLIKTDSDGTEIWGKTFNGGENDWGHSVQQTNDGGYIITGSIGISGSSDIWLIKTDADGDEEWNKTFGGSGSQMAWSVEQTNDGGYIVSGHSSYYEGSYADPNILLVKTDTDGNEKWSKIFGGNNTDIGYSIKQTSDRGYVIVGRTNSYGAGDYDVWLIKTDHNGNEIWNKTFGGSNYDQGDSVQQTTDGGYIIAGSTMSYGAGDWDAWLIKTDSDGNEIWNKTFGGTGGDGGDSVQQTIDGGYIFTGTTNSDGAVGYDLWLIKIDTEGNEIWRKIIGGDLSQSGRSIQQTFDGGYIIVGKTSQASGGGTDDFYLIKLSADCINQPRSDLTGDCKTDLKDFSIMLSEWLDCGQYDPNDC